MATETIAPHAGDTLSAQDIGSDQNPYARAEVAEDCSTITVIWIEPLHFHLETFPEHMENLLAPKNNPDDEDEPVCFTDEARQEFATYMSEFLASEKWNVAGADILPDEGEEIGAGDEPCVAISYCFDAPNGPNTTIDEAGEIIWPFIAAMTNVTDPGTFNNPYVMRELSRRIAVKREEA